MLSDLPEKGILCPDEGCFVYSLRSGTLSSAFDTMVTHHPIPTLSQSQNEDDDEGEAVEESGAEKRRRCVGVL